MNDHFIKLASSTKEAKAFQQIFQSLAKIRSFMNEIKNSGENKVLGYLGHLEHHLGSKTKALPTEIAKHQHMTLPRISTVMKSLESKKFIVRIHSSDDCRKVYVSLTPKGKKEFYKRMKMIHAKMFSILNKLPKKDLDDFVRIISNMSNLVEKEFKK